jgi:DNA-directed RNA polymerase subunit alpha
MQQELVTRNWRSLIRPRTLEVEDETLTERYGRFACEPLERGFGITLGNALRRVLISSLQGAAITNVRITGIEHEFTTIPGVLEDVTDIVLNLKDVRLRLNVDGPKQIRIHKKGKGTITAADLAAAESSIEVMNPEGVIATFNADADVEMELTVGTGNGYVLAEANKDEEAPIGTIPIDSVFSPVQKVNYTVTPARVGRETDYDRLNLEVWTDGSMSPEDAVAYAAKILKEQLSIFISRVRAAAGAGDHAAESEPVQVGGRARAVGALGELPAERQHPLHRRTRAKERNGDAQDQELRAQVAERDQGDAGHHEPGARDDHRRLPGAPGHRRPAGARGSLGMRHRKRGGKLSRTAAHRTAMLRNMVTSLLEHERIETTDAKAKQVRRVADRMITLGKRGTLGARRRALRVIRDRGVAAKVFADLAGRFAERPGGYTRVVKRGLRVGDAAAMSIVELVEPPPEAAPEPKKKASRKKASAEKAPAKKASKRKVSAKKVAAEKPAPKRAATKKASRKRAPKQKA